MKTFLILSDVHPAQGSSPKIPKIPRNARVILIGDYFDAPRPRKSGRKHRKS